jgi:hypothetical protein
MHFISNIPSDGNLHRHKLAKQAGVQDFSELSESSHIRSQFGEVDHFVLGWGGRHFGVFGAEDVGCGEEPEGLGCWFWESGDAASLGEEFGDDGAG